MELEVYGIFFILVLFALLGCGIAYACICGNSCIRKRAAHNGLLQDRRRSQCQHRNLNLDSNRSVPNPQPNPVISRPLINTISPILNWSTAQPSLWPMQRGQSIFFAHQDSVFGRGRNTCFGSLQNQNHPNLAMELPSEHASLVQQENYFLRNELNLDDLPPTYEEAMKAKIAAVPEIK